MTSQSPFQRLVRFVDEEGKEQYGDLALDVNAIQAQSRKTSVPILMGDIKQGFQKTSSKKSIIKLLCPIPSAPIIPCIGLNYQHHATEANLAVPSQPVVFVKPADALTGPYDDVYVHPEVQKQLDYEGELTVIIGRDAKNLTQENALEYVLGYTCGNDVSARDYQRPADVCGGQFCYAKSFDRFAPIGPTITSTNVIPDPQKLDILTKVNGEVRQKTSTSDMIWSVKQILVHLSRGTTLRAGTCIMTGTPSGVGLFMKPQEFLNDRDMVEVEIENIGAIRNKFVFE